MCELDITAEGRRCLDRLPPTIHEVVLAFVFDTLAVNPRRVGKPLAGGFKGLWSARRAEYRVVYEIDEDRSVVLIHRVALRGHAYRPR